jgi:hypothetical protein
MADDLRQRVAYEMEMGGLDKVNSDLQGVSSQADKSSGAVGGLSDQFALGALKAQAVSAALAFVAEALKSIPREIQAMTDLNASLFDSATRAGLLVEQYQALGYVMRQAGGSVGDAQTMIRSMNSLLNQASVETSRQRVLLDELGLSYTNLRNSDPVEAFYDITDAVGQLSTSQERNLALSELFGNRYSQIISGALNQTQGSIRNATLALEEQGLIIETDTVNAYKVYSDMQTELQARMEALKSEALLPTLPILENIIDLKMDLAERAIPKAGEAVTVLTYMLGEALEVLVSVSGALNDVKLGWDSLPRSLQLLINPLAGSVEAIYEGAKAMMDADNASQQMEDAYARQAEAARLQAIALTVMNDELALTPQQLRGMVQALDEMTLMGEAADPVLQQVNERLATMTWQTTEALGPLSQYTAQELSRAIAIRQTNVALLEQWDAMGKSGPAMQERIDRIRNEIALLKEQAASLGAATVSAGGSSRTSAGGGGGGGGGGEGPKAGGITKADALAREMAEAQAMQEEYLDSLNDVYLTKEAQRNEAVLAMEQTAWESRYEIGMHYSGMMVGALQAEFMDGFDNVGKAFEGLVKKMMAELVASGLLSWASSLLGGGPVGIFGQIFGGGGK